MKTLFKVKSYLALKIIDKETEFPSKQVTIRLSLMTGTFF